jgi:phosphoribosylglycinamide formyltransferase-1
VSAGAVDAILVSTMLNLRWMPNPVAQTQTFVSEPLRPAPGSGDPAAMATGVPGAPRTFTWRGASHELSTVVRAWKTSGKDRGERYLRRHWFEIVTTAGVRMTIYCERQARAAKKPKARWWVYTVAVAPGGAQA